MKKKPIRVTKIMKERIRAEMKRNKQTDQDMADKLFITRQQYNRIINGKYQLLPEYLKKMVSIWGVRENYLLGIDLVRTDEDFCEKRNDSKNAIIKAEIAFLETLGISIEWCELIHLSIPDLVKQKQMNMDIDKMIELIDPYICDPRQNWNKFKRSLNDALNDDEYCNRFSYVHDYYFLTNGFLRYDFMDYFEEEDYTEEDLKLHEHISNLTGYSLRTEIDGVLIGYCDNLRYQEIIQNTVKTLFKSLVDIEKKSVGFIEFADNSIEMMEHEEAVKNEPLPFA